jgi:hypothetical protein
VATPSDCDDTDPAIHPGATEVCDADDNDCDGLTDDDDPGVDLATGSLFYADLDLDGDGDPLSTVWACAADAGRVSNTDDCDDADPAQGPCASCLEVLDAGLSTGDGLYRLDPCGLGAYTDYYCDMTQDGGGWTVAGWQSAGDKTQLGNSDWGTVGGATWSQDLTCVAYSEIAVFNRTYGQFYSQSYTPDAWSATTGNQAIGPAGTAFKQGTYGPSSSLITMACVDYSYSGAVDAQYACDNDGQRGQKGHIADYAGEFCTGGRLDGTWAWTDGSTCLYRSVAYTWGIALR